MNCPCMHLLLNNGLEEGHIWQTRITLGLMLFRRTFRISVKNILRSLGLYLNIRSSMPKDMLYTMHVPFSTYSIHMNQSP